MPTLADIFSAADTFKRNLSDLASNPGASLQQMLGYANDRARNFNQTMSNATNETVASGNPFDNGPANQALNQAYAGSLQPVGMISGSLTAKYPNVALDVFESPKAIDLSRIVVPKEMRGQGIGSSVMQDLIDYADQTGKQVRLSPSSDFGGSPTRLKKFYKEFGFVENKGKNKDFSTIETMIRNPELKND